MSYINWTFLVTPNFVSVWVALNLDMIFGFLERGSKFLGSEPSRGATRDVGAKFR